MKRYFAIFIALIMTLSLFACGGGGNTSTEVEDYIKTDASHPERYGGVLRFSYIGMGSTYDPYGQSSWTTYVWAANVFESPLALGDDGKVYPLVCNYEVSDDGKTITLKVRDGVTFSDGTPVTVDDVLASLKRSGDMIAGTKQYLFDMLDHVDNDGTTLTFVMKEFNVNTMNNVFAQSRPYCGIMKKDICEKYGTKLIDDPNDLIGTGPYKVDAAECELGSRMTFVRNPKYTVCRESPEGNGVASPKYQYLDALVFYPVENSNSRLMSLMGNKLDVIECNNEDTFNEALKEKGTYKMETTTSNSCAYFFFNLTSSKGRQVNDVNLRKAIAACFDYAELINASYGSLGKAYSSPLLCGDAYVSTFEGSDYYGKNDLDLAKKYLDASSYDGSELKLIGNSYLSIVVEAMKKIGINANYSTPDNSTMVSYANDPEQDWDVIYRTNPLAITSPADIHSTMYKTWNNDRAAELVNLLGSVAMNSPESLAYWAELDKLMVEEVPVIIVSQTVMGYAMNDKLELNNESWYRMYWNAYWQDPANHTER